MELCCLKSLIQKDCIFGFVERRTPVIATECLGLAEGILAVTDFYVQLLKVKNYTKEVHIVMIRLEALALHIIESLFRPHENLCREFGQNDTKVWLDRIKVYYNFRRLNTAANNAYFRYIT